MKEKILLETNIDGLGPVKRGKVRDIYDLGEHLLIVATDRISAFDVVLPNGIPDKGHILTSLSEFWFNMMEDLASHHLISTNVTDFPKVCHPYADQLKGRSMLVKKTAPLPVECIVRSYLSGSGWKEYCAAGRVCGLLLPPGLKESGKLTEPIFTPSTKAHVGDHDVNITFETMEEMVGVNIAHQVKALSLAICSRAQTLAERQGIIISDTKLEFGILNGEIIIIDELLTPDSSRFWPLDSYSPGKPQKSLDKQFVRDYLTSINWDKKGSVPELPPEIVCKTRDIYLDIFHILTSLERQHDG
ncbi:MAG: phosphoribosylaminoimidazolesuccinocarboxamide synthase [Nitrospinota bacterium]